MKRGFMARKAFMILFFATAFVALFSFIVMLLWNAILPQVMNVTTITFWQALGILVLSKILFSGFGGWGHKRRQWRERMQEKWQKMTPEERIKFRHEWKARCGGWGGPFRQQETGQQQEPPAAGYEKQDES